MRRFAIGDAVDPDTASALRRILRSRMLVLASASPRRRSLLAACGIECRIVAHSVSEPRAQGPDWRSWVRRWSLRKAEDVARTLSRGLVLGSDTIVVHGRQVFGKPKDADEAVRMLRRLSGSFHTVFSGIAIVDAHRQNLVTASEASRVVFRRLQRGEIDRYVATGEPMDKAGAYGIQGGAGAFVDHLEGPLDNVIGLPLGALLKALERIAA